MLILANNLAKALMGRMGSIAPNHVGFRAGWKGKSTPMLHRGRLASSLSRQSSVTRRHTSVKEARSKWHGVDLQ